MIRAKRGLFYIDRKELVYFETKFQTIATFWSINYSFYYLFGFLEPWISYVSLQHSDKNRYQGSFLITSINFNPSMDK